MRVVLVAIVAAVMTWCAVAHAQAPGQTIPDPFPSPPAQGDKDGTTATLAALGFTAAGFALAGVGAGSHTAALGDAAAALIIVGPSAGHIYAGETGHALGMSLLRTAAIATVAVGVIDALNGSVECAASSTTGPGSSDWGGSCRQPQNYGSAIAMTGGLVFVAATAYDLWDAHRAARRANERHASSIAVLPTGTGFAIAGRF